MAFHLSRSRTSAAPGAIGSGRLNEDMQPFVLLPKMPLLDRRDLMPDELNFHAANSVIYANKQGMKHNMGLL